MKELIGNIFAPFAEFMFTAINAIPLGVVRGMFFGILLALAVWIITKPSQLPADGERSRQVWYNDVRLFAVFVLALQALLYIVF